ncbi:MAG: hypothetical protein IPJ76_06685 [Flavobacteriales bacterium]|nr:MAG: hypothetical protein IPJ76_06685 [Flavobacteriales bacterium]
MKTRLILPLATILMMAAEHGSAQNIGINVNGAAPDASALLDIDATALPAANKKGLLVPRVALTATNVAAPVVAPAPSLLVYNTNTAGVVPTNVTPGYYYWDGAWVRFATTGQLGWGLTGNAGTVAGTNFIGTTDAVDWVIKTGGSAATNERARVLSGGQTVVNNTGLGTNTNDVFSVYSNATTNGATANISALGARAINGYASGTGVGVFGTNSGNAATTFGMLATAPATTGTANALRAEAAAPNSSAVIGIANTSAAAIPTATTTRAVLGQVNGTIAGTGVGIGVLGAINATMTTGDARGVQGQSPSALGIGVFGVSTSAAVTNNPIGVLGGASSNTGFGMDAYNTGATGTALIAEGNNIGGFFLTGGSGVASTGSGVGLFSLATTVASGTGVLGVGNNTGAFGTLVAGSGLAGTGTSFGVYGVATSNAVGAAGAPARAGGYFVSGTGGTQSFTYVACYEGGGVPRKVMGNGTVNTVVKNTSGQQVLLSAPEAPENLFQDYGQGMLVNGRAHVDLDPTLARNILVNEQHPLRAFVQLRGDCNGVFVTNETATGFDVIELNGGTSNVGFNWTVTANRANEVLPDGTVWNYAEERFPVTQGAQETKAVGVAQRNVAERPTAVRDVNAVSVP